MTDPDAFSIEGGCACGQPDALAGVLGEGVTGRKTDCPCCGARINARCRDIR